VIVGARSEERGKAARDEIAKETGNDGVSTMIVDVASIASVRAFGDAFRQKHDKLHVLVNNAGAWFTDRRESPDGHELTFATNVLGPHLLCSLLDAPLRAAAPSRIVNVVSAMASNYDGNDLDWKSRSYDGMKAYGASKQALRMLTWAQATRLTGSGVTANAAAPGFVKTDFNQNAKGFTPFLINLFLKIMGVTADKGADTPLWAAVAPELEGVTGKFFDARTEKDGKFREPAPITELEKLCGAMVA
jgi:NAD(P)-dependent dehydrogenase (short-subunit alcohol dehydrogenase family)